ncbi:hypothetical protein MC378_11485 [Polaribacter sp. MSW13]|uniref:GNAT family N-acetyltransferase n=1 Tax=Polaribacter marinus TaxID=2916838 RepID=A0A9X1VP89_9FLAO|nr:hypothetical protein [Polaribacter marinus]MCI2229790.1 hypothetical protein [Polaribacter marinus]
MINFVKRRNLDVLKYDDCIENSLQSRVYAFSWYLDIVANNWGVLVLNDYEAVMPIPFNTKYFIKYATQPYFCQQLGIFSKNVLSEELQRKMLHKIPFKFVKVALSLNAKNLLVAEDERRKNYILKLHKEYVDLQKDFSKGRKHAIKVGEKAGLNLLPIPIDKLIEIQNKNYKYKIPEAKLKNLAKVFLQNNKGNILGVFKDNVLLGGGFFIKDKHKVVYLYSAFTAEGRRLQAASFLIANIIKKYQNSNIVLDFEGGNLPNIGKFYRSFGAEEEVYATFNKAFL